MSSIIPESLEVLSSDIFLHTDASNLGFGAILGNLWIIGEWEERVKALSIDFKELFAIVAAAAGTWGEQWAGKRIVFHTDNQPITHLWDSRTTKAVELMSGSCIFLQLRGVTLYL